MGTNEVIDADDVPGFAFSVFRIMGGDGHRVVENVVIKDWFSAQYDESNQEAFFSEDDPWFCAGQNDTNKCLLAVGTHKWCRADWSKNPFDLDESLECDKFPGTYVNERSRSFQVIFKN